MQVAANFSAETQLLESLHCGDFVYFYFDTNLTSLAMDRFWATNGTVESAIIFGDDPMINHDFSRQLVCTANSHTLHFACNTLGTSALCEIRPNYTIAVYYPVATSPLDCLTVYGDALFFIATDPNTYIATKLPNGTVATTSVAITDLACPKRNKLASSYGFPTVGDFLYYIVRHTSLPSLLTF